MESLPDPVVRSYSDSCPSKGIAHRNVRLRAAARQIQRREILVWGKPELIPAKHPDQNCLHFDPRNALSQTLVRATTEADEGVGSYLMFLAWRQESLWVEALWLSEVLGHPLCIDRR